MKKLKKKNTYKKPGPTTNSTNGNKQPEKGLKKLFSSKFLKMPRLFKLTEELGTDPST